ncbi:cation transporter [Paenibacillus swuensis]|uniref:Ca(2+)/H(+) antiporter n=1 Tax=Paenibacillus swuensis TaxID=1178515 RepID=A0A172TPG8_9BACL|nr:calcium/proton exchanger [Paenibacillus swuensis]ANE48951.1 cation transporter [Paenibacillus swuensis]
MKKIFYPGLILTFAVSALAHYMHLGGPTTQFGLSALAILFAAGFMGKATESVAHYAGDRMGGFLNATFGNAAELIIAIFLIKEGLFDMVKASLTGSIIGNLLLVLGLSLLAGGIKFKEQRFNALLASHNASLMILGVIALFIPAMFLFEFGENSSKMETLSLVVSALLIIAYVLWLLFSMITHKKELSEQVETQPDHGESPVWSAKISVLFLALSTVMVAFISEWMVGTLESFSTQYGLSELFVGAFLVAIVGNAAEHSAAIMLAYKGKIGAAVEIAVGSSLQIALFVSPVLVFISFFGGNPMDLVFMPVELVAIAVSVFIAKSISQDGSTNWFEGALLLIVYLILGVAFYLI